MPRKYQKKPIQQLKIAKRRIDFLFKLAKEHFKEDSRLSDKYVGMARKIAMKYKIRLSPWMKKRICKHCHKYLIAGVTSRVRVHKHRIIYYCLQCRNYTRYPIK